MPHKKTVVENIKLKDVELDPNLRKAGWEDKTSSLETSVDSHGLLSPVVVVAQGDKYRLVCGYRRFTACQKLGYSEVPAVIMPKTDENEVMYLRLVENTERENLSPLEEAQVFKTLVDSGIHAKEVATRIGKTGGYVSQRLALLKMPDSVQLALEAGTITTTHVREIGRVEGEKEQERLLSKAQKLSGPEFREYVDKKLGKIPDGDDAVKKRDDGTRITAPIDPEAFKKDNRVDEAEKVSKTPQTGVTLDRTIETIMARTKDQINAKMTRANHLRQVTKARGDRAKAAAYIKGIMIGIGWATGMEGAEIPETEEDIPAEDKL